MAHSSTSRLVTGTAAAALAVTGIAVVGPAHAASQPYFSYANGWRVDQHVRELADVNGDGRADVVGFGDPGTFVAYGRADGTFAAPVLAIRDFGTAQGWRVGQHPRTVGDVTGDGRADIVGFGHRGIHVARSIPTPPRNINFYPTALEDADFGVAQGWRVDRHPRALADITGDGVHAVVGFGNAGTWLSDGYAAPLTAPQLLTPEFGYNSGWTPQKYPRLLGDINGDGRDDIVGFGHSQLTVRLS